MKAKSRRQGAKSVQDSGCVGHLSARCARLRAKRNMSLHGFLMEVSGKKCEKSGKLSACRVEESAPHHSANAYEVPCASWTFPTFFTFFPETPSGTVQTCPLRSQASDLLTKCRRNLNLKRTFAPCRRLLGFHRSLNSIGGIRHWPWSRNSKSELVDSCSRLKRESRKPRKIRRPKFHFVPHCALHRQHDIGRRIAREGQPCVEHTWAAVKPERAARKISEKPSDWRLPHSSAYVILPPR